MSHRDIRDEVSQKAREALATGLGIHDAALVLEIVVAFEEWSKAHGRQMIHVDEVVGFLLTYGKAMASHEASHILEELVDGKDGH